MSAVSGLSPVIAVAFVYAIGLDRMWQRVGRGRLVSPTRAVLFLLGLAVTGVALGPPLDGVVQTSFTAHMTQHVLLIWVSAPLLVAGSPMPVLLWVLPDRHRIAAQRRWRAVHRSVAGAAWPLWVGVTATLQGVVLAVWHLPVLYQAALDNSLVHAAEHASFLLSAVAFWWTIAGAVRRSRFGAGVLAVFVAKLPGLFLGVGLTLSARVWYPHYGRGAGALHDQQAAGVVMWVGGGMVATITALVLFGLWMQALERATPPNEAAPRPAKVPA